MACVTPDLPEGADIWVLAGQSNMAGSGRDEPYEIPDDRVWLYSLRNKWGRAEEPFSIDRYASVEYAFAIMRGERGVVTEAYLERQARRHPQSLLADRSGAGLGLALGKELADFRQRPVGLVFCAKGDMRMEEWDPDYNGDPYMALWPGVAPDA